MLCQAAVLQASKAWTLSTQEPHRIHTPSQGTQRHAALIHKTAPTMLEHVVITLFIRTLGCSTSLVYE